MKSLIPLLIALLLAALFFAALFYSESSAKEVSPQASIAHNVR